MMLLAFLRDLRDLLASPNAWHPGACANREGFQLGEFEQDYPGERTPTWHVPTAWNLPCAIRYLTLAWAHEGRFADPIIDKECVRQGAWLVLCTHGAVADLWAIREHRHALAAIDGALGQFAERRRVA